jgi:DNA polymerase-3 subunit epsilon
MAPVLDSAGALHGFVLTLDDITRHVEADNRLDDLQQLLTQDVRATLAHIRSTTEAMRTMAHTITRMEETDVQRVLDTIDEDTRRLAGRIDQAEHQHSEEAGNQWHLEEMRARDLLALLQRRIGIASLAEGTLEAIDNALWLKVDSYTLTMGIAHLEHHLRQEQGVTALHLALTREARLAWLDLSWKGPALPVESLRSWEEEPLDTADRGVRGTRVTLASAVSGRSGRAAYHFDDAHGISHYRVPLRVAKSRAPFELPSKPQGRPEFYDFDLFRQAGQDSSLDERALTQLSYTVFDTETTGLNPAGGDEIISIGALRIVNGRLLTQESFDRLVHPGMFVNPESTAIHGIDNAMLKGRPGIDKVLPQFHRFVDNTVLIAHNAAFDMKFLQLKEERTGIRFRQPVLDTLLLSKVLHPHQKDHSLDAIARRFGVAVVGRHTALGDTLVTAEVFLKMLPLLAEKGIRTLRQARQAAQEADYARVRY